MTGGILDWGHLERFQRYQCSHERKLNSYNIYIIIIMVTEMQPVIATISVSRSMICKFLFIVL